ncbi:hypothetical protein KPL74_17360 [Bacillus sp. NP157]|nr:hypothetical protein KPL74_17360 [Bacillus sp. NP157]
MKSVFLLLGGIVLGAIAMGALDRHASRVYAEATTMQSAQVLTDNAVHAYGEGKLEQAAAFAKASNAIALLDRDAWDLAWPFQVAWWSVDGRDKTRLDANYNAYLAAYLSARIGDAQTADTYYKLFDQTDWTRERLDASAARYLDTASQAMRETDARTGSP